MLSSGLSRGCGAANTICSIICSHPPFTDSHPASITHERTLVREFYTPLSRSCENSTRNGNVQIVTCFMPFNAQAQKRNRKYIRQDPVRMALQESRKPIIEGPLLKQLLHAGSNYGTSSLASVQRTNSLSFARLPLLECSREHTAHDWPDNYISGRSGHQAAGLFPSLTPLGFRLPQYIGEYVDFPTRWKKRWT